MAEDFKRIHDTPRAVRIDTDSQTQVSVTVNTVNGSQVIYLVSRQPTWNTEAAAAAFQKERPSR